MIFNSNSQLISYTNENVISQYYLVNDHSYTRIRLHMFWTMHEHHFFVKVNALTIFTLYQLHVLLGGQLRSQLCFLSITIFGCTCIAIEDTYKATDKDLNSMQTRHIIKQIKVYSRRQAHRRQPQYRHIYVVTA